MSSSAVIINSPSALTVSERAVRFHDECVLIPEPLARSRRPRLVTKSYSLPLWRRKYAEGGEEGDLDSSSSVDIYLGFKVSVPKFTTKPDSPPRGDASASQQQLLHPCLVQQSTGMDSTSPTPTRSRSVREASSSTPSRHQHDLVTVPLRPCCADCEAIWEQSRREGEDWTEKFTKGAKRRRNSSSDSPKTLLSKQRMKIEMGDMDFSNVLSIKVDEVDIKRGPIPSETRTNHGVKADDMALVGRLTIDTACSPVSIKEEEEDQLFPLPSPRRSPNSSASSSPSASSSSLALAGTKDTRSGSDGTSRKSSLQNLRLPGRGRSQPWSSSSPSSPSPLRPISFSAPLPSSRNMSLSSLPVDPAILDADAILSPSLTRSSSTTSHRTSKGRTSFAKAGSGLLKGVFLGLSNPALT